MNSSSNAQQQLPPLNLSIGSIQVAERFVIFLFGIGTIQTIIFFKTNKYIFYWNKIAVFLVWLLSVIHVLTTSHLTYHYLVTTRGDLEGPLVGSYTANIVAQLLLSNLTQLFYFLRLRQIFPRRNKFRLAILSTLVLMMFMSFVANLSICISIGSNTESLTDFLHPQEHPGKLEPVFEGVVLFGFIDTSAIDFCLTVALFYALRRSSRVFGWTDSNLLALASYMINTGLLASVFSVSCIITFLLMKYNLIYQALRNFSTEFYAVSFLAMVNAPYHFEDLANRTNGNRPENHYSLHTLETLPTRLISSTNHRHNTTTATDANRSVSDDITPTEDGDSPRKTINEVGLPLFNRNSSLDPLHSQQPVEHSALEVNMTREQRRAIEHIYLRR